MGVSALGHAAGGEWPDVGLEIPAFRAQGWKPTPFRHYVIKLHSRCNLACTYCYIYAKGDTSWRSVPRAMTPATLGAVADRIAQHVSAHQLEYIKIIFHGGEPLLAGWQALESAATAVRRAVPVECAVDFTLQTNGVLLDDAVLGVLHRHRIGVGVSLDGGPAVHDEHRPYRDGRGSSADVARILRLLNRAEHAGLFSGLLCTIDVSADPVGTYEALLEFRPPVLDFLLPHGNWTDPPPFREPGSAHTPYAEWLATVFDRWYDAPVAETSIRIFEQVVNCVLGGRSSSEAIGLSPVAVIVVDTGGRLEQVDALRSVYHGAAATGLDVFANSLDDALDHPGVIARQIGLAALHEVCQQCPVGGICGGGFYPHRYRQGDGYRNPSVYCPDLKLLIDHIGRRVTGDVRALSRDGT